MYTSVVVIGGTQLAIKSLKVIQQMFPDLELIFLDTSRYSKTECMEHLCSMEGCILVLSIMNQYIITPEVVYKPNLTIINVHHALLPGHRGRNAQSWALYHGESETGITWHFVDKGIDTGKIIRTFTIQIEETDTSISLLKKQNDLILDSLKQLLPEFIANSFCCVATEERGVFFHLNSEVPNNGELSLEWNGICISRFLRAMDFGPYKVWGMPYVVINEVKYYVKKYQIDRGTYENNSINVDDGVLTIKKDDYCFRLRITEADKV